MTAPERRGAAVIETPAAPQTIHETTGGLDSSGSIRSTGDSTGEVLDFDSPIAPESDAEDAGPQRQDASGRASRDESWESAAPVPARAQGLERERRDEVPPAKASRPLAPRLHGAAAAPTVGRTLPHSIEAEEYLLSSCMLDGADVVPRCEAAGIESGSFYDPKHETVYGCIVDLFRKGVSTDVSVVAEHLKTTRQLDLVGGYAFLAQVSSRIPTTAQAGYFIEKVRELSVLRQIIRAATGAVEECYNYAGSGELPELAAEIEEKLKTATGHGFRAAGSSERSFMDYEPPPANDESILLGKYRFLCRGGALIEVGTSGAGKSSASLHQATMWALGRDWLGITCTRPLKSLIVQAEDDDGDIGEIRESIVKGLNLSYAEIAQVRRNVIICDERVRSGNELIRELKRLVAKHKPDLVWLNPLLRYAACDITKQSEWSQFYSGLNSVNAERNFAYIFVHHTNKPPSSKEKPDRSWNEYMYNMTGSADIVNAVRAVILFEAQAEEGRFLVRLAKRGKRAGLTRETKPADEYSPAIVEPVTVIYARWSKDVVKLPDGRAFPMMFWCPDSAPSPDDVTQTPKRPGPAPKITFEDLRPAFVGRCPSPEKPAPFMQILHAVVAIDGTISKQLFAKILKAAVEDGKVVKCADGRGYHLP